MRQTVDRASANHPVGRLLGVKEGDDKLAAAEKALRLARMAGFSARQIKGLEKIVDDYKSRNGIK